SSNSTLTIHNPCAGTVGPDFARSFASYNLSISPAVILPRPTSSSVPIIFRSRRSRKRRKIVHAHKPRRRLFHRLFIQRKRVVQHIPPHARWHHLPSINPVPVNFPARRPPRIKIRPRLLHSHNPYRRRQQRIHRSLKLLRR